MMKAQLILIAGPYRSGTDGEPQRIAANLQRLEQAALEVYQRGHVPVIGEWLALPWQQRQVLRSMVMLFAKNTFIRSPTV